jgi:polyhydroxybutyrate depolymerase
LRNYEYDEAETLTMKLGKILIICAVLAGAAAMLVHLVRANSSDVEGKMAVDGRERTYLVHVPPSYSKATPAPLVVALHGRLGTGRGQEWLGHLDKVSDDHGFVVVYPDGINRSWADGRGGSPSDQANVNDVKFISELIDRLAAEHRIDSARVYVTGMSNGGFMSGRLACELADKIAAAALVGASMSVPTTTACKPSRAISVLIMQGTKDPFVPYQGGALGRNGSRGQILSHQDAVEKWVALNHCTAQPSKAQIPDEKGDGTSVDVAIYEPCAEGTEVRDYTIVEGGHTWPGGLQYLPQMIIGKTTKNMDASEVIWEFFARHSRVDSQLTVLCRRRSVIGIVGLIVRMILLGPRGEQPVRGSICRRRWGGDSRRFRAESQSLQGWGVELAAGIQSV